MTDHIDLAKWHWKNKCFIVLFWWHKTHSLEPCQFRFARLSLVGMTPLQKYQPNTLIRKGIFSFQSFLLLFLSIGTSKWINAFYIESTKTLSFSWIFQRNSSGAFSRCTFAKLFRCFYPQKMWRYTGIWYALNTLRSSKISFPKNTLPWWRILNLAKKYTNTLICRRFVGIPRDSL
jgi:hypothetical protein